MLFQAFFLTLWCLTSVEFFFRAFSSYSRVDHSVVFQFNNLRHWRARRTTNVQQIFPYLRRNNNIIINNTFYIFNSRQPKTPPRFTTSRPWSDSNRKTSRISDRRIFNDYQDTYNNNALYCRRDNCWKLRSRRKYCWLFFTFWRSKFFWDNNYHWKAYNNHDHSNNYNNDIAHYNYDYNHYDNNSYDYNDYNYNNNSTSNNNFHNNCCTNYNLNLTDNYTNS